MIIAKAKIILAMSDSATEEEMDNVCDAFDEFVEKIDKLTLELKQTYPELDINVKTE